MKSILSLALGMILSISTFADSTPEIGIVNTGHGMEIGYKSDVHLANGLDFSTVTTEKATYVQPSFQATNGVSAWSGSAYYDLRAKHAAAVVFNRIGDLTIHGKPTGVEADGFVGASNQKGTPATFGFAAIWHRTWFDQVSFTFGIAGSMTGGKWGGGPVAGLLIHF